MSAPAFVMWALPHVAQTPKGITLTWSHRLERFSITISADGVAGVLVSPDHDPTGWLLPAAPAND